MAISINWATKVIYIPQSYLTLVSGSLYELDINQFRLDLKDLEDDEEGMAFLRTHNHSTETTVAGTTLARVIEIINGYTITFEDGQYAVNLFGANSNIADSTNINQVSIRSLNTAGLIVTNNGSTSSWDTVIEGTMTAEKIMRILLAVATGKTTIVDLGNGLATVTFRDIADTKDRVTADMDNSERTSVTLDGD